MSALEGEGFNNATIQTDFVGVKTTNMDRLRETRQRNGVAIPVDHEPA
jgi:hypothetical protein